MCPDNIRKKEDEVGSKTKVEVAWLRIWDGCFMDHIILSDLHFVNKVSLSFLTCDQLYGNSN